MVLVWIWIEDLSLHFGCGFVVSEALLGLAILWFDWWFGELGLGIWLFCLLIGWLVGVSGFDNLVVVG